MQHKLGGYWWLRIVPQSLRSRLADRSNLVIAINNSGWLLFDKLMRMFTGLLVSAKLARYLGPTDLGKFAYAIAYLAFFQAGANLGMDGIVVRDIARDRANAGQILGTAFALRVCAGFALWLAAVFGLACFVGWDDLSVRLTALAGGMLVFQASDTVDLWFQSQSQSRRSVVAKLIAYLVSNGLRLALIIGHASLPVFAFLVAFDALASAIALFVAYSKFPCGERWKILYSRGAKLLLESWPFVLSGLSIMIYMRIDQIMIKDMLGDAALGIYAAALPLSQSWAFIPTIIAVSVAPMISRAKEENQALYISALVNLMRFNLVAALLLSCSLWIGSAWIIRSLYGASYAGTVQVFSLLVFINVFLFLGVSQSLWVVNESARIITLGATISAAVIGIIINLVLIPKYGIIGGCISALASSALSIVIIPMVFMPGLRRIYIEVFFGKNLLSK